MTHWNKEWDKVISLYPYADGDSHEEAERRPRVFRFMEAAALKPSRWSSVHSEIKTTVSGTDHSTAWKDFGKYPIVMSETYDDPSQDGSIESLGLSGRAWWIAPQQFSIYQPDTYIVLITLARYREVLIDVINRLNRF